MRSLRHEERRAYASAQGWTESPESWSLWSRLERVAPPHDRLGSPCLVRGQTRDSLSRCGKCSKLPSMFHPGA